MGCCIGGGDVVGYVSMEDETGVLMPLLLLCCCFWCQRSSVGYQKVVHRQRIIEQDYQLQSVGEPFLPAQVLGIPAMRNIK